MAFVHLHTHTVYSLLDGAGRIDALISRAKELGQNAIAITDHGVMYGVIDFYRKAKSVGIKPIIGCEVYIAARSMTDKNSDYDRKNYHLILLAENEQGYKNLMKIVSIGYLEGFYGKPRVDRDVLRRYSKGLIALSACIAGEIPRAIIDDGKDAAKTILEDYISIFGKDNFFLELQDHGIPEEKRSAPMLIELADEYGIGLVATNDIHYVKKEDSFYQDVLMCIQMGKTLDDDDRMKFESDELYVKSEAEMLELFSHVPQAIENTQKIADRCNVEIEFGHLHLPAFHPPCNKSSVEYLHELCFDGGSKRYGSRFETDIKPQLEFELDVIEKMGYIDYFLIVWDFIHYAKTNNIMVGPGRGSAAGSVVSFCLGITDVEPTQYNLLFERFLNPERVSMPDIDIDFCYRRRQEVIDYVVEKYGKNNVAQIVTFGTLAAKAAIKDVGRVMNIPYNEVDYISKQIPNAPKMTIDKAMEINSTLNELYNGNEQTKRLIDTARALEGVPRHASTHAAGVVITENALNEYVPLSSSDGMAIAQFNMTTLEELGLLKMDFLGLRNLTVIQDTLDFIPQDIDLAQIDYNDNEVFKLISAGDTDGVFQLESEGMKSFMRDLKPQSVEDIIAGISLFRPGPMDSIPRYVRNKNNPDLVTYKHPLLEPILNVTYGCVVYQEQVMQIVRELGGYSLGRSDLLRRAMSKKKADVMKKEKHNFIYGITNDDGTIEVEGAIRRGIPEKIADEIFEEMMDFSSYAFNKSHAAAYAQIAYQTAWLKAHYPVEFMAALLSSEIENQGKITKYIANARKMGIRLLAPDVNNSEAGFSVSGKNIRFGLVAIKNVGHNIVNAVIDERKNGKYLSFTDFCTRTRDCGITKRVVESLIRSGAFDTIAKRSQLIRIYESVLNDTLSDRKNNLQGQLSLFNTETFSSPEDNLPDIPELPVKELLAMEKEGLGIYVSGHPLDEYANVLANSTKYQIVDVLESPNEVADGDTVSIAGIISSVKRKFTKNNAEMAYVTLEDLTADMEVIVFPKQLNIYDAELEEDKVVCITGRIDRRDDETCKMLCERVRPLKLESNVRMYIKVPQGAEDKVDELLNTFEIFHGDTPVIIYYDSTKKAVQAPEKYWVVKNNSILEKQIASILGESSEIRYR